MIATGQRVIVAMMDGLDMAYVEKTDMPHMRAMMADGFFKEVGGVFPSVTNVNNVSIACGAWPDEHGIVANSYFNEKSGKPVYMNAAELIRCPTIFRRAAERGIKSALLTSKKKTLELFHQDVDLGVAAENAPAEYAEIYGPPPDIYSREINYWLWTVAVDILEKQPEIGLLYVHITDYPMHAWGPDAPESRVHLHTLDKYIGQARQAAPDAAFLITADHGMNFKTRCYDLQRVLAGAGLPPRFVLSPERDYYIVHHRNFTGCSWIWLNSPDQWDATVAVLEGIDGIEEIYSRRQAAERFHLVPDLIGDLIATGDRQTMFGEMDTAYEDLPSTYRAHGSLYEMRLPLVIYNSNGSLPSADDFNMNLDLTRFLYR
ncbi:MAG: alkaline phosphatase family protein [Desulfobacteraceae bacterium]|jgi:phosphonoacetate hydrolase